MTIPMTQAQIAVFVHCLLIALQIVPLFTSWTPTQQAGWSAMLGGIQMAVGQVQKNMEPVTGMLPRSSKD